MTGDSPLKFEMLLSDSIYVARLIYVDGTWLASSRTFLRSIEISLSLSIRQLDDESDAMSCKINKGGMPCVTRRFSSGALKFKERVGYFTRRCISSSVALSYIAELSRPFSS